MNIANKKISACNNKKRLNEKYVVNRNTFLKLLSDIQLFAFSFNWLRSVQKYCGVDWAGQNEVGGSKSFKLFKGGSKKFTHTKRKQTFSPIFNKFHIKILIFWRALRAHPQYLTIFKIQKNNFSALRANFTVAVNVETKLLDSLPFEIAFTTPINQCHPEMFVHVHNSYLLSWVILLQFENFQLFVPFEILPFPNTIPQMGHA